MHVRSERIAIARKRDEEDRDRAFRIVRQDHLLNWSFKHLALREIKPQRLASIAIDLDRKTRLQACQGKTAHVSTCTRKEVSGTQEILSDLHRLFLFLTQKEERHVLSTCLPSWVDKVRLKKGELFWRFSNRCGSRNKHRR